MVDEESAREGATSSGRASSSSTSGLSCRGGAFFFAVGLALALAVVVGGVAAGGVIFTW